MMAREDWAPNWRSQLADYIDSRRVIGTEICLLMPAGAVEVLTGVDHTAPFRDRLTSLAEAKRAIGMSPLKLVGSHFAEIHISEGLEGDIVATKEGRNWVFGVLMGAHFYVQRRDGLGILPRSSAIKAFRVE